MVASEALKEIVLFAIVIALIIFLMIIIVNYVIYPKEGEKESFLQKLFKNLTSIIEKK